MDFFSNKCSQFRPKIPLSILKWITVDLFSEHLKVSENECSPHAYSLQSVTPQNREATLQP